MYPALFVDSRFSVALDANVGNAGCDRSISEGWSMSAMGRPQRGFSWTTFNIAAPPQVSSEPILFDTA